MNGNRATQIRKIAEAVTAGYPPKVTKKINRVYKRQYKVTGSVYPHSFKKKPCYDGSEFDSTGQD